MALELQPLSAALGVEVRGLDLSAPVAQSELEALRAAWRRARLLLVRAAALAERDQIAFVRNFGPVLDESMRGDGGASYVSNRRDDGFAREGPLWFHCDLAFTPDPLQVISLYAVELPRQGSSTRFANAALAAQTLSEDLRRRAAGLHARQLFDLVGQRQDIRYRLEQFPDAAQAVHPLLRAHAVSGEPVLFVGESHTDRILELADAESEVLLQELLAHLYRPEHLYEHSWRPGDLLVWDNQTLQHGRPAFDAAEPRTLRRVVAGGIVVKAYEHVA